MTLSSPNFYKFFKILLSVNTQKCMPCLRKFYIEAMMKVLVQDKRVLTTLTRQTMSFYVKIRQELNGLWIQWKMNSAVVSFLFCYLIFTLKGCKVKKSESQLYSLEFFEVFMFKWKVFPKTFYLVTHAIFSRMSVCDISLFFILFHLFFLRKRNLLLTLTHWLLTKSFRLWSDYLISQQTIQHIYDPIYCTKAYPRNWQWTFKS